MGPTVARFSHFLRSRKSVIYCEISPFKNVYSFAKKRGKCHVKTHVGPHPAHRLLVCKLFFFFFKEDSLYLGNQVKYINEEEPFILSHDESNSHCRLCPEAVRLLDLTVKGLYSELAYFTPMLLSGCPHCKVP